MNNGLLVLCMSHAVGLHARPPPFDCISAILNTRMLYLKSHGALPVTGCPSAWCEVLSIQDVAAKINH